MVCSTIQQVVKILDGKYEKAVLNVVVTENCKHVSVPHQEKLLKLLTEFEDLFDGLLCVWDTEPVSLKPKEAAKAYMAGLLQLQKPIRKL